MTNTNETYFGCCGSNSTALISETIYCSDCDQFATIIEADIEFTDGSVAAIGHGGIICEVKPKQKASEVAA